jgi:ubiquinone/menaquinone biosynthesis C-methylase UbiE
MKLETVNNLLKSKGYIDSLKTTDHYLKIAGWVGAENARLTDFIVFIDGFICKSQSVFIKRGISSPDIEKLYPELQLCSNARFEISVPIELIKNLEEINLVYCIPVFDESFGRGLFKFCNNAKLAMPPDVLIKAIGGGFQNVSFEFLDYFIQLGNLKPTERVLDVGCGIGRMAYAMTGYLNYLGSYEGFDVVEKLIEWPTRNITNLYPNFKFRNIDLYNKWYNPKGKISIDSFPFPYENESIDFVILCSVFTHMIPNSVTHYLKEIYRVLEKNGRCLCTAFLINEESKRLIEQGKSSIEFVHSYQEHFVKNVHIPEETIGYEESALISMMKQNNFEIKRIEYGSWPGRKHYLSYQDVFILKKRACPTTTSLCHRV